MSLRIAIAGCTGWVGRELLAAVLDADDLELGAAIARKAKGQDAAACIGRPPCGVLVTDSFDEAVAASVDVLIDYTSPASAKPNCLAALGAGCAVVIGSSGLRKDDFAEIDAKARRVGKGVIASGNFSITATLLKRFALEAARYVADVELIDYAGAGKPDTPSGTTAELADALAAVRQEPTSLPTGDLLGEQATRGAGLGEPRPVQVHALRLPSYVLSVEALFGADDERLVIRHDAGTSAKPYVAGTLLAAKRVTGLVGLTRGLDKLI